MKFIALLAILLGALALMGTKRETPFLRWGIIIALAGVLLMASAALFTARGVMYGVVLSIIGVAAYYYGRVVRREHISLSKPK